MPSLLQWREQLSSSITTMEGLSRRIFLSEEERRGIRLAEKAFHWRISPHYAGLMDPHDPRCPIRRQAIPSALELEDPDGVTDPIGEEAGTVAPNLVRLYGDRVALLASGTCAVLCRFCFRRREAGKRDSDFSPAAMEEAFNYIRTTPEIRDVLVTGGDPLLLPDDALALILSTLRKIPHVEIIRIGTRVPVTLPQRITGELCETLRSFHPLWINTHFNHPRELAPEALIACAMLADSGIPLGNQSVLLRGVNDDPSVMKDLVQGLVKARIRPYYLFQCHLSRGTSHFRTPIEAGLRIVSALRGSTSGLAVPTFVVDTPHGKVPVAPETVVKRDKDAVYLRCHDGSLWREANPRE
jgi:lysine 2,3-aminomutase